MTEKSEGSADAKGALLVASWNVNSIRARLQNVTAWLDEAKPDIALLQEIKAQKETFPFDAFEALGYNCAIAGQKSYNGVAVLSRHDIDVVCDRLEGDSEDHQARYLEVNSSGIRAASIYLPNGNPPDGPKFTYKLDWMARLRRRAEKLLLEEAPFLFGGDFNVIPEAKDCHDPAAWEGDALFRPEVRREFRSLCNLGLNDAFRAVNPDPGNYTFWDYQGGAWQKDYGIRIDHILLSPQLSDRLDTSEIDRKPRGKEKASDHTPVWARLLG